MEKLKLPAFFTIMTIFSLVFGSPVTSARIDGVTFNDEYTINATRLTIRGYAILNYMFVIRAYAGALYLPADTASSRALSETPRILELHYFHAISAQDFRESTTAMIKKNTTSREFNSLRQQVDALNALYRNVVPGDRYRAVYVPGKGTTLYLKGRALGTVPVPGDRYRAVYVPGKGTTLYLKGRALGTVPGAALSKAFFSIWIGKNPIDKGFRNRLLGTP